MTPDIKARTKARPIVVDGVTFHCYRCGILQYRWTSDDGRCSVQRNHNADTYCAAVDGYGIPGANQLRSKRFRSQKAAMTAAVKQTKKYYPGANYLQNSEYDVG